MVCDKQQSRRNKQHDADGQKPCHFALNRVVYKYYKHQRESGDYHEYVHKLILVGFSEFEFTRKNLTEHSEKLNSHARYRFAVYCKNRDKRAQMQQDVKGHVPRQLFKPRQKRLENHKMSRAGYRQKFRQSLYNSEYNRA